MAECDNNIKAPRLDEKRKFLLPLILLFAGAIFVALGFFGQLHSNGKFFSEYEFNRAIVGNDLSELEIKNTTTGKDGKAAKPSKIKKKDPDFCPT